MTGGDLARATICAWSLTCGRRVRCPRCQREVEARAGVVDVVEGGRPSDASVTFAPVPVRHPCLVAEASR